LSTRSRVTSIKFIYLKLITVIVELKWFISQRKVFNPKMAHERAETYL
jgi:hypothetical protein